MSNKRLVTVKKDDITAEVPALQVKGLTKNGWTVVDDGSSESGQAVPGDEAGNRSPAPDNKE